MYEMVSLLMIPLVVSWLQSQSQMAMLKERRSNEQRTVESDNITRSKELLEVLDSSSLDGLLGLGRERLVVV